MAFTEQGVAMLFGDSIKAGDKYYSQGKLAKAALAYEKAGRFAQAAVIWLEAGETVKAAEAQGIETLPVAFRLDDPRRNHGRGPRRARGGLEPILTGYRPIRPRALFTTSSTLPFTSSAWASRFSRSP